MAQCVMSSVAGVRASVPVPRSTRVSQPRKLNGPRVVTARAITQTVAETPNANAALYDQFKALLVDYEFSYKIGDRVSGKVFHCDSKGAWVDIGAKAAALCPAEESSLADVRNAAAVFDVGEEYEFEIIKDDDGDGSLTLSIRKIQLEAAWDRCRDQQANDEAVNSMVLSVNRGGLLVEVEHLRGFVPQSHIAVRVTNREDLVGQLIPVKFLEVDEEKNRLVMSNRLATDMVSGEGLGVGDVVTGVVQAVKPYGAFVDVGGVSGLLHISQISHDRIVAVENVLAPGDELKVLILSKDADRSRLSLSTKKLEPSPGDMLRNPALVFEKAEEMGRLFRERVAAAEAAAQAEEGAGSEMAGMAPVKAESTDDKEA